MKLVIATRLHLGRASSPPPEEKILSIVSNLKKIADDPTLIEDYRTEVLIAVDASPKIEGYDYVEAVKSALKFCQSTDGDNASNNIHILPVTPWGKFVPALNALILHAKTRIEADLIMFISAEVNFSSATVHTLCQNVTENNNVIVAGAAMNGHDYHGDVSATENRRVVALTGRTTPWNTLCVWNLEKLCLTGFSLVSDLGKPAGVEECVAIALLQKIFPESEARLVKVEGIRWEEQFVDEERKKWHHEKMISKVERPKYQLELMQLSGTVIHC
mmetsp:Transcript_4133/g.9351  ORF Transcript_4133/g.9351 Transcript_4133/m.9351 type:complete len:274 (+) Transcript_4133:153-974(+)